MRTRAGARQEGSPFARVAVDDLAGKHGDADVARHVPHRDLDIGVGELAQHRATVGLIDGVKLDATALAPRCIARMEE